MTCLGVLKRGECDKNNETGLEEGGGIQILTTVLHSRAAPSLKYSPVNNGEINFEDSKLPRMTLPATINPPPPLN